MDLQEFMGPMVGKPSRLPPELQQIVFTAAMAYDLGVTARRLQGPYVVRLFHNVYADATRIVTPADQLAGLQLAVPKDCVVALTAAAWTHGADVRRRGAPLEVIQLRHARIHKSGIKPICSYLEPADTVQIGGIDVTSPVRTAFDLARQRDLVEAVVGVDAMLNRGGCDREELAAYIADHREWYGVRWAEEVLGFADAGSQSPMESRKRMHLILAGLPRPKTQVPICDLGSDEPFAYGDLGYEEYKIASDWDGKPHEFTWQEDTGRQQRIFTADWWHRRWTSLYIHGGWSLVISAIGGALRDRGWEGSWSPNGAISTWRVPRRR